MVCVAKVNASLTIDIHVAIKYKHSRYRSESRGEFIESLFWLLVLIAFLSINDDEHAINHGQNAIFIIASFIMFVLRFFRFMINVIGIFLLNK